MDLDRLQSVGLLFRNVNFNFREQVDQALRDGGIELSFAQISALGILAQRPGINGAELARRGMVSAQAMNAVLRSLSARGYLERQRHPGSQRADAWYLRPKGVGLLSRARGLFGGVMSRMLSALSAREQHDFERYLRLCAASLEQVEEAGGAPRRRAKRKRSTAARASAGRATAAPVSAARRAKRAEASSRPGSPRSPRRPR